MAQVKKQEVYDSILASASRLFQEKGYNATSVADIGQAAGMSTSNIYVYFGSKIDILFSIYNPWFEIQLDHVALRVGAIADRGDRLAAILEALWMEIPSDPCGFPDAMLQALISSAGAGGTREGAELERFTRARVEALFETALPAGDLPIDRRALVDLVLSVFHGILVGRRMSGGAAGIRAVIDLVVQRLLVPVGEPA